MNISYSFSFSLPPPSYAQQLAVLLFCKRRDQSVRTLANVLRLRFGMDIPPNQSWLWVALGVTCPTLAPAVQAIEVVLTKIHDQR